jgi:hypothetical protein
MWVYGCVSEDTEILTLNGWERYHKNIENSPVLCYSIDRDAFEFHKPTRSFIYENLHPAFRIRSDSTDQIVSRNHRCVVERGGRKVFEYAENLRKEESIPILENLLGLPETISYPDESASVTKQDLLDRVSQTDTTTKEVKEVAGRTSDDRNHMPSLRNSEVASECVVEESKYPHLFQTLQRDSSRSGMESSRPQRSCCVVRRNKRAVPTEAEGGKQSCMEGRSNLFSKAWKLLTDKVCSLSSRVFGYGSEGWLYHGASFADGTVFGAVSSSNRGCSSFESQPTGQQTRKSDAVREQQATQTTRSTRAEVTEIEYQGRVWCVEVPTGAFVARRNGRIFITGNSGFPKSHDVSKAIDKMGGDNFMSWFPEWLEEYRNRAGITRNELAAHFPSKSGGVTGCVWNWEHGIRVPTADQFNQLCTLLNIPAEPLEVVERRFLAERAGVTRTFNVGATETLKNRDPITAPATDAAKQWSGWGTALKPAYEPILMCRKPLEGTVAQNVLEHGTGAINIDGCRISGEPVPINKLETWSGFGQKVRPDYTPTVNTQGRWPANIILSHSPDCKLRGMKKVRGTSTGNGNAPVGEEGSNIPLRRGSFVDRTDENGMEEVEDWECVEGCPIREFPESKTNRIEKPVMCDEEANTWGGTFQRNRGPRGYNESGSAARFFYCAKASRKERNAGLETSGKEKEAGVRAGNSHPT